MKTNTTNIKYISVTEWENIPKDYKIEPRSESWRLSPEEGTPRQVFAGCIIEGGGTTLLTEGEHFEILPDLEAVKKANPDIADNIEGITGYYRGKPSRVKTNITDPDGKKCEIYLF